MAVTECSVSYSIALMPHPPGECSSRSLKRCILRHMTQISGDAEMSGGAAETGRLARSAKCN